MLGCVTISVLLVCTLPQVYGLEVRSACQGAARRAACSQPRFDFRRPQATDETPSATSRSRRAKVRSNRERGTRFRRVELEADAEKLSPRARRLPSSPFPHTTSVPFS